MSSTPVHIGFWHDYTLDGANGWTLTLSVKWSAFLLAALSTFVAIVGGNLWSLIAFAIHQWRASPGEEDGVYFQQQVIYRNLSQWRVIIELLKVYGAWRSHLDGRTSPRRLLQRSLLLLFPPVVVVSGFTAAGIFVGSVTRPTYESNNVKIRPTNCGVVLPNTTVTDPQIQLGSSFQRYVSDTLASRAYARSCYSGSTTTPAACGEYAKQILPFSQTNVTCPFGKDSNGTSLCSVDFAFRLDTGLLDTSDYLGINAPKEDRLLFRRSSTCSPIRTVEYAQLSNYPDLAGFAIWEYDLGPVAGANYTYLYNTHATADSIPYQVTLVYGFNP
jgi:hypothetical protein